MLLSCFFIGTFTYYTYYRGKVKRHLKHFLRRTFSTYILTFILAVLILTIIHKGAFMTETLVLVKRAIIVSFPASMSAAIADNLK